ncbi:AAA family ATPase [Gloeocapsopsis crepidinum LEGE 06123]|uniref:AAA family ATPase n=1 Tax=Gloeocapsopsis crepidinum LEGE 06123 TaxID=588587 RepID=A0ABR9UV26_9CHRO|nr:AAA family ATPase [Gloeocapsopsis crepidinum]MBE9191425.1 AAA family ATPase [Gloeocapsopsis crepidinum LEGE 06123]
MLEDWKPSSFPDNDFLAKCQRGDARLIDIESYFEILKDFILRFPINDPRRCQAEEHYFQIEKILERMNPPQYTQIDPNTAFASPASSSPVKRPRQPREKTLGELESEIIAAATSSNPKLALTQVAALNGFQYSLVEHFATSLIEQQGLGGDYDLQKQAYTDCIRAIRELELKEDPGEKDWKLFDLARKYGRSKSEMLDNYYKSLLVQHLEDPISLQEFLEKNPDGQKWLLRGWIPERSITLFHGHGGIGKTLYTHHLIKHIVTGVDWEEYKVREGKNGVLYVQTDTPLPTAVEALKNADIPIDAPIQLQGDWRIEFMHYLYRWIEQQRPALVIIDSLSSACRFSTVSENQTEYARPILQLRDIASEFGCSFIIIHHSNGEGEARGSKAIRAAVDQVWKIDRATKNEEDPKRILTIQKSRSRATKRYELEFDDEEFSWNLLEPEDENGEPIQNRSARWLIVNHLHKNKGDRFCIQDLAQTVKISEATVRKELSGLAREGAIDKIRNPNWNSQFDRVPRYLYLMSS